MIFTLVAIIRVAFAMFYHDVSLQGSFISVSFAAKVAFKIVFILHIAVFLSISLTLSCSWVTFSSITKK